MNWEDNIRPNGVQRELFPELDEQEQQIMKLFEVRDNLDIDTISYQTNMKNSEIAAIVLNLEFKGLIKSLPGKRYVKV